jgi:hypothetical protein
VFDSSEKTLDDVALSINGLGATTSTMTPPRRNGWLGSLFPDLGTKFIAVIAFVANNIFGRTF